MVFGAYSASYQMYHTDKKVNIFPLYTPAKEGQFIAQVGMAKFNNPTGKNWMSQVLKDLEKFSIHFQIEEIEDMQQYYFLKNIVKEAIKKKAFEYLLEKKGKRTSDNDKGKKIKYMMILLWKTIFPKAREEDISI